MARGEACGNDHHLSFEVIVGGQRYVFDSFECVVHGLVRICSRCGCRIIGHGV
jgi:hypothetical protein